MNKEEKENLRAEYNRLKGIYKLLKDDRKKAMPDSLEMYEMNQSLSIIGWQISDIR